MPPKFILGMQRANLMLVAMAGVFVAAGIAFSVLPHTQDGYNQLSVALNIIIGILCFAWCKEHSRLRGIDLPSHSALIAGLLPILGLPLYFFRALPLKAAVVTLLKAIAFVLMLSVFLVGTAYLTHVLIT